MVSHNYEIKRQSYEIKNTSYEFKKSEVSESESEFLYHFRKQGNFCDSSI